MTHSDKSIRTGSRRLWRILLKSILAVGLLVLTLGAAAVLGLRSSTVRKVLLDRVGDALESAAGIDAKARDFSLSLWSGELTIEDLTLSVPDAQAPSFLTAPRVHAMWSWRELLGDHKTVRALQIEEPRLDLGAPLPESDEPGKTSPGTPPHLDIERIELAGGEIASGTLPPELEPWLDAFRADAVAIGGSLRSGVLDLDLVSARLVVENARRPPIEASLRASGTGRTDGELRVETLELAGDGLRLTADGRGDHRTGQLDAAFEIHAELVRLVPDLTSAGKLDAEGRLSISEARLSATADLDVQALPGELLVPWLAAAGAAAFDATGTTVDIDADLQAEAAIGDADVPDRLAGRAVFDWRRGKRSLAHATVHSLDDRGPGLRLAFSADLLPGESGRREIAGELSAPGWRTLDAGELAETRLVLEVPDLTAATELLGLAGDLGGIRPAGRLDAIVDARGRVAGPELRLDAAWTEAGEPLMRLTAQTVDGLAADGPGNAQPLRLTFEAELLPESAGSRRLTGALAVDDARRLAAGEPADVRLEDTRLELRLPDLAADVGGLRERWRRLVPQHELPWPLAADSGLDGLLTGALEVEARGSGWILGPRLEVDAAWHPADGESLRLSAAGKAGSEAPFFTGWARLALEHLDLARLDGVVAGRLTGTLDFDGAWNDHRATFEVDIEDLAGEGTGIGRLRLEARSDGTAIEIATLEGTLTSEQSFSGVGRLRIAPDTPPRLAGGELRLRLPRPIETLEEVVASLAVDGETVSAEIVFSEPGAPPRPVVLLRAPLGPMLAAAGLADDPGRQTVFVGFSGLSLEPFLPLFELSDDASRPRAVLDGSLEIDLADFSAAAGDLVVADLAFEGERANLEALESLRLTLAGRCLILRPARLLGSGAAGTALEVAGELRLAEGWRPRDGLAALVTSVAFDVGGSFETAALDSLLGGGRASGEAAVELKIRGPAAGPAIEGFVDASRATFVFARPYLTRIEGMVARLSADRGGTRLDHFEATLNGGLLSASGSRDREQGLALTARFSDVRYRVDYGLTVRAGGNLELSRSRGGRGLLAGDVVVERGSLRRDLVIGRELLSLLFAPNLTSSAEASFYNAVDLDLTFTTTEGVRVKNNLGDLRADWGRLHVRGTLQNPLIEGRIDVDPGGKVTAYGQTLRIDEASISLSGDPAVGPRLELETTTSLEDPLLRESAYGLSPALGRGGPGAGGYWGRRRDPDVDASEEITTGLMNHYTDRVAGALSRGLGSTELSLEPLPVFGETDTEARLTATQRLSANADLIYSVNPRDAEGQTYILDLHGFDFARGLASQLFNNDEDNEGATLVQTLELGGRRPEKDATRLARIATEVPAEVSERRVKQAIGLRKGDAFPEGGEFDVESDALEELRRQGFPDAAVRVTTKPSNQRPGRLELGVTVASGPRIAFEFEGETPSRAAQRSIVQSYSTADEEASLEEIRRKAVRALREEGFLDPEVEVTAEAVTPEPDSEIETKTVRILGHGGRRIDPGPPVFTGVSSSDSYLLAGQLGTRLARVELAAAVPGADHYLLQSAKAIGYPQARIVSRRLEDDGRRLVVDLEPGPRQRLARIEITGLAPEDEERVKGQLPVHEGQPLRSDLVTRAAHAIEDDLRARGYAETTVQTTLEPVVDDGEAGDRGQDLVVRFAVDAGSLHHVAGIRFEGLKGTRESYARRVAGLERGGVLRRGDVGDARRRLSRTQIFERVRTSEESEPAAGPAGDGGNVATTVVFDVEERPRWFVAYGGRWESGEGIGLVADAIDRNFLGRGTTLGLRAIYSGIDDRSLRLYLSMPRFLGTKASLEVFLEGTDEKLAGLQSSSVETWAQITSPLGRRTQSRFYTRYQDLFFRGLSPVIATDPDLELGLRVVVPSIGWQLNFDTRERTVGARRPEGLAFSLDLVGAHESLGSDVSLLGVFSQLRYFRSLATREARRASGPVTWAQSLRVGLQEPFGDTRIPIVSRLRAGGEYSVRGYRTDSLGPLDTGGSSFGGELFFILNEELHFPVWREKVSGLVFFDAGNVWESREALDSELFTSLGLGFRASTRLGPIRLDVAFPLDRRDGIDDSVKVYLGFGNVF